jgi:hypothetical protein
MTSISRSMFLAAGLLAFPLAGAVAQAVDTGKSTDPAPPPRAINRLILRKTMVPR